MTLQQVAPLARTARHRRTAIVIGHRGASGYRPEHTLAAYSLAIAMGADSIEPDLVMTGDGVPIARHENEISRTTDVSLHPAFAERRTTRVIDGVEVTGWFTEDFTLAEIKTLRAMERLPALRPESKVHDGRHQVATLDEILALVRDASRRTGRRIGIHPEIKNAGYFASLGLPVEPPLLAALRRHRLDTVGSPVFLQSFETTNLRWLADHTDLPLIQLVEASGGPADLRGTSYADLVTPAGLAEVASYAHGIGVAKDLVLPRDPLTGATSVASTLVADAHRAGLLVHVWTFRAENQFLPTNFRVGTEPTAHGDLRGEIRTHLEAGIDGVISDFPDLAAAVDSQDWRRGTMTQAAR